MRPLAKMSSVMAVCGVAAALVTTGCSTPEADAAPQNVPPALWAAVHDPNIREVNRADYFAEVFNLGISWGNMTVFHTDTTAPITCKLGDESDPTDKSFSCTAKNLLMDDQTFGSSRLPSLTYSVGISSAGGDYVHTKANVENKDFPVGDDPKLPTKLLPRGSKVILPKLSPEEYHSQRPNSDLKYNKSLTCVNIDEQSFGCLNSFADAGFFVGGQLLKTFN